MFMSKAPGVNPVLQKQIDEALSDLSGHESHSDEYAKVVTQLKELYALKELETPERVDPNTLVTAAANIAGILVIINYERANIITSKALSFIKLK